MTNNNYYFCNSTEIILYMVAYVIQMIYYCSNKLSALIDLDDMQTYSHCVFIFILRNKRNGKNVLPLSFIEGFTVWTCIIPNVMCLFYFTINWKESNSFAMPLFVFSLYSFSRKGYIYIYIVDSNKSGTRHVKLSHFTCIPNW